MKGSVEGRCMYLFRCNFSCCSESTEIRHANSFCVEKCPCIFSSRQKNTDKIAWKSHPPPPPPTLSLGPSPNNVGFPSLRTETLYMGVIPTIGGRGELSWTCLKPCFPACGKKPRHLLTQKQSAWLISVDSEQLEKSQWNTVGTYASLPQSPSNAPNQDSKLGKKITAFTIWRRCLSKV